jgi:hypothetical protein
METTWDDKQIFFISSAQFRQTRLAHVPIDQTMQCEGTCRMIRNVRLRVKKVGVYDFMSTGWRQNAHCAASHINISSPLSKLQWPEETARPEALLNKGTAPPTGPFKAGLRAREYRVMGNMKWEIGNWSAGRFSKWVSVLVLLMLSEGSGRGWITLNDDSIAGRMLIKQVPQLFDVTQSGAITSSLARVYF